MKNIIRQILREEFEYKQQLFDLLRTGDSDNIEMVRMISQGQHIDFIELLIEFFKENGPPYFKLLNHFDLSEDELKYVFYGIFGEPVSIYGNRIYNDKNDNVIYYENYIGDWEKYEYNDNGNTIYYKNSDGFWKKWEYRYNTNIITYYEDSDGYWWKREYDDNENRIYFEDSNGVIRDYR